MNALSFHHRRRPTRAGWRAFTLIEILIVVMILAILAAIVVPRYSAASDDARLNATLDQLRIFRDQINIYRAQHNDNWPGADSGNPSGSLPLFTAHLTGYSDVAGATSATRTAACRFGPYLQALPINPISGLDTVKLDSTSVAVPTPDGTTGWIYQPATGRVSINSGATDGKGNTLVSY